MVGIGGRGRVVEVQMGVSWLLACWRECLQSSCLSVSVCVCGVCVFLAEPSRGRVVLDVCVWIMVYVESTGRVRRAWMTASAGRGSSGHAAGC